MVYQKEPVISFCKHCGDEIRLPPSMAKLGRGKYCKKPECKAARFTGENNPFWNKKHSPEARAKMKSHWEKAGFGHLKGVKKAKDTPERRKQRSEIMRKRWSDNREVMLSYIPTGEEHHWKKPLDQLTHRIRFTAAQRRQWMGVKCEWCEATDNLILDHVLPVAAGGTCIRENSQTLCQPCNLWKMWYVDRPLAISVKASLGGQPS